ncbi:CHAT domain-containing protein [Pseudomonas putida]|uniref:CHAT domain-containing protein n=1 Tax=Pseudomonas putida TaxID=303 RepID=UPI001C225B0D|nr:CHAT domain-containing protein [Pseudomonas putida]
MTDGTTKQQLLGFNPHQIFKTTADFKLGAAELIVGGECTQVLGRMAACILRLRFKSGEHVFNQITVIAPPIAVWNKSDADILQMLSVGIADVEEKAVPPQPPQQLASILNIERTTSLDSSEVVKIVERATDRQLFLIPTANLYRSSNVVIPVPKGATAAVLLEDLWVPHLTNLASHCLDAITCDESIIVLSAPEDIVREENVEALCAVEGLYPAILESPHRDVLHLLPVWVGLASTNRAEQAYKEIAQATLNDEDKRQAILQVASRAKDRDVARPILEEYLTQAKPVAPAYAARLAHMAAELAIPELAIAFYGICLPRLSEQIWLETALWDLTRSGPDILVEQCWNRLHILFPSSAVLWENCDYRLIRFFSSDNLNAPAMSRAGFGAFHSYFASALENTSVDYDSVITHVQNHWPEHQCLAALGGAYHALNRQHWEKAIELSGIAQKDQRYNRAAVNVLLTTVRQLFLHGYRPSDELDAFKLALIGITRHLALHPHSSQQRAELASILDVASAGSIGLPMLASFAIELASAGSSLCAEHKHSAPADPDDLGAFMETAQKWMSSQTAIEPGITQFPHELVSTVDPKALITSLSLLVDHAIHRGLSDEDLLFIERCAVMISMLVPVYAPDITDDLEAMRIVAIANIQSGNHQRARDLAEQILQLAGSASNRQRIAWGAYGDILQRTRDTLDALIGLVCAAQTGAAINPSQLFQEAYVLLRAARELHLYDLARSILPTCKELAEIVGAGDKGILRLEGIELAIDVAQEFNSSDPELQGILERTAEHCRRVVACGDELTPAAALFLQVAGALERLGQELPIEAASMRLELLPKLQPDIAPFVHAISAAKPSLEQVVWLFNRLGATAYGQDVPLDQASVVLAAHRLLLPETDEDPRRIAVGVELLSDRAAGFVGVAEPLDLAWPESYAIELSLTGVGVLMVALDSQDELCALIAESGQLRIYRPTLEGEPFKKRLLTWSTQYPYSYADVDPADGSALFIDSMEPLGLPMPNTQRVLVIAQPLLQQIPFNLVRDEGAFAGEGRAISVAPSLTWLQRMQGSPRPNGGRRIAWISTDPGTFGAMEMTAARLNHLFDQYSFELYSDSRLPHAAGASIAVITAHGQLTSTEDFFLNIKDEQELTESPANLARAFEGVELVILFVCSGGRIDQNPYANTTVGLPRNLLDRGARAVIASPWPLDTLVPEYWLERFMAAWEEGLTVAEATYLANQRVRQRLGDDPGRGLAMTVYGDGLLTK